MNTEDWKLSDLFQMSYATKLFSRKDIDLFTFFSTTFTKNELIAAAKASFTNPDDVFGS